MTGTSSGSATVTLPAENQILIKREFNAPRRLVYKAYTKPELVKRWWSGQRGVVTSAEIDLRVGGRWRFVMRTHGGLEVAFHGEYREIVTNERLVSTEVFEGIPNAEEHAALDTASFIERAGGRSTLTILVETRSREDRDAIISSGMEGGINEAFDLLEQVATALVKGAAG